MLESMSANARIEKSSHLAPVGCFIVHFFVPSLRLCCFFKQHTNIYAWQYTPPALKRVSLRKCDI